jgi:hypothetical protein
MIHATATISIRARADRVFITAADPHQQLIWDAGNFTRLETLTEGPLGKGSRFSCYVKGMGKMVYEFSEYLPFSRFVHVSTTWMSYGIHDFDFSEKDGITELTQTMKIRLRNIGILLYPFAKGIVKKQLKRLNNELKKYIENTTGV